MVRSSNLSEGSPEHPCHSCAKDSKKQAAVERPFQEQSVYSMTLDSQRNGVEPTIPFLDVTLVERKRTRPRVIAILDRHEITGLHLYKDGVANDIIASQLSRQ
jgi:hypothetical protein